MSTQSMLAHIPLLFHPNPQSAMILGLASGITAGEALNYDLDRLDILEISEQVVQASDFFSELNSNVLSYPNTNVIIQDGRVHLELSDQKYDVITSEPSNPWMAGLASLFTEEFFRLAKNRLNWDGIFVQWLPSYQMDWTTFSMVGRTFAKVFPNSLLMKSFIGGNDYLLIGFKGLEQLSLEHGMKNLPLLQNSPNLNVVDPRILYRLMVSDNLPTLFGPGPVHNDDHPILEFLAPKRMHISEDTIDRMLASRRTLSDEIVGIMKEVLDVEGQLEFARFALSVYAPFLEMVDPSEATEEQRAQYVEMLLDYSEHHIIESYEIFNDKYLKEAAIKSQIKVLKDKLPSLQNKISSLILLTNAYAQQGDFEEAIKYCKLVAEYGDDPVEAYLNLGLFYMNAGHKEEAIIAYKKVLEIDPYNSQAHNNLGTLYEEFGQKDAARAEYELAIQFDPDLAMAHFNVAHLYMGSGAVDSALLAYQKTLELDPKYIPAYFRLSKIYKLKGETDKAAKELEKVIRLNPDMKEAQTELMALKSETNKPKVSVQMPPRTAESDKSKDPRYFYNQAIMLIQKKKYEEAIVDFNRAIALKPDYLNAIIALGASYQALRDSEAAIDHYKKALTLNPNHSGTHNNLAIIYYSQKNYKLAIEHVDKALTLGFQVRQAFQDELLKHR
ncbi:tetratricopeptide repeat protein [bacterium]|nr:tetratricopeptide repeat protein [bacterium]